MILKMALLIKILIPVLVMAGGYHVLHKRVSRKSLAVLALVVAAFAAGANAVAGMLPPIKDVIVLTALGEKNENAKKEEVYITGFTIDGQDTAVEVPVKGNWYWNGDMYCWRPASDSRRPKEITDSISLAVPVGWERTINFAANEWRGIARIETHDRTVNVDTYLAEGGTIQAEIGRSSNGNLLLDQARRLAVYAAVLLALSGTCAWAMKKTLLDRQWPARCVAKRGNTVFCAICAAVAFFLLRELIPSSENFNGDHLICLGIETHFKSLREVVEYNANGINQAPPLADIINYLYCKIAPSGIDGLCFLPRVYAALAVFFLGKFGSSYINKQTGFAAAILGMSSVSLMQYGQNIRSYSLVMLLSVLLVYAYANIRLRERTRKRQVLFFLAMTAVAYCNYHVCLLIAGLFLCDAVFYRKRFTYKVFLPYFAAGACYLPWVIAAGAKMVTTVKSWEGNQATWHQSLTGGFVRELLSRISGQNGAMLLLFLGSLALLLVLCAIKKAKGPAFYMWKVSVFLVVLFCSVLLAWALLSPSNPMLNYRYFAPLFPIAVIVESYFVCAAIGAASGLLGSARGGAELAGIALLCVIVLPGSLFTLAGDRSNVWTDAAEKVISDSDVYYQTSCVFMRWSGLGQEKLWGIEYLMYGDGQRQPVNCSLLQDDRIDDIMQYERLYVIDQSDEERQMILDRGYEIESSSWPLAIYNRK